MNGPGKALLRASLAIISAAALFACATASGGRTGDEELNADVEGP